MTIAHPKTLSIGYSTCPNDTFLFDAMVHGRIDTRGYGFEPVLEDVETLNLWASEARLPVTKLSFAALGQLLPKYALLPSGAALGRGCGPLLVGENRRRQKRFAARPWPSPAR